MNGLFSGTFGDQLLTPAGLVSTEEFLEGKEFIGVYFAAHWSPPCRQFTPVLKEFYETVFDSGKLEIIFVSSDSSEEDQLIYYKESHGSWAVIPYGSPQVECLKDEFGITGIPQLIILRAADLSMVTANGRNAISELEPTAALDYFRE